MSNLEISNKNHKQMGTLIITNKNNKNWDVKDKSRNKTAKAALGVGKMMKTCM